MKIVIVGSGASAMMASYAARAHDVVCWSLSGKLGGQFDAGPFRLVRNTPDMREMLDQLDMSFETWTTQPGMIHNGDLCILPDAFAEIRSREAYGLQASYRAKSRGEWARDNALLRGMCEPEVDPCVALDLNFAALAEAIGADDLPVRTGRLASVDAKNRTAIFKAGAGVHVEHYDMLIVTCPIDILARSLKSSRWLNRWYVPSHVTSPVDLVYVDSPDGVGNAIDPLVGFDAVWTPVTPRNVLMRLSHDFGGYVAECQHGASLEDISADLAYALPFGHHVKRIERGLRGVVTADPEEARLPPGIIAAGPHATGKMVTIDETLAQMMEIFA